MNPRKLVLVILFLVLGIILVSLFWENSLILIVFIVATFLVKHKVLPIEKEFLWFVITGVIGAVGESIIMLSGPWRYAASEIVNFPVWLLFLWGYAGVLGVSLYQAITDTKN